MATQFISLAYRSLAEAVKYGLENEDIVSGNRVCLVYTIAHVEISQ